MTPPDTRLTRRLRLEPIGPHNVDDLFRLHQDPAIIAWYGRFERADTERVAARMARSWRESGAGKWLAYHRESGELIGRGGASAMDADDARIPRIAATLPGGDHWSATRLELGWAVLGARWGHGYATEIGAAGLALGLDDVGASSVVAFTEEHNARSRSVMERLGMSYAGDTALPGFVAGSDDVQDDAPFVVYRAGPASRAPSLTSDDLA